MTLAEYKDCGGWAWPGGYPIIPIMDDCQTLCRDCVCNETEVHQGGHADGWRIDAFQIFYEGAPLYCAHCNAKIESAYGDPDSD